MPSKKPTPPPERRDWGPGGRPTSPPPPPITGGPSKGGQNPAEYGQRPPAPSGSGGKNVAVWIALVQSPKESEEYLVLRIIEYGEPVRDVAYFDKATGAWTADGHDVTDEVTHWMPCPALPGEWA